MFNETPNRQSICTNNNALPVADHFNRPGHDLSDLRILGVAGNLPDIHHRKKCEVGYIIKFKTQVLGWVWTEILVLQAITLLCWINCFLFFPLPILPPLFSISPPLYCLCWLWSFCVFCPTWSLSLSRYLVCSDPLALILFSPLHWGRPIGRNVWILSIKLY